MESTERSPEDLEHLQCSFAQIQIHEDGLDLHFRLNPTEDKGRQVLHAFTMSSLRILPPISQLETLLVNECSNCKAGCSTKTTTLQITVIASEEHCHDPVYVIDQFIPAPCSQNSINNMNNIIVSDGHATADANVHGSSNLDAFNAEKQNEIVVSEKTVRKTWKPRICKTCNMHYKECKCAYQCNLCKRKYVTEKELTNHKWSHTERSFACTACEKLFTRKSSMKKHFQMEHTDRKNYQCAVCRKKCLNAEALFLHKQKHVKTTEHVNYKCNDCGKISNNKYHFKQHLLTHVQAPFKCSLCKKGFRKEYTLQLHMRMHDEIRKFVCELCQLRFSTQKLLVIHSRRVHSQKQFKCVLCVRVFTSESKYNSHLSVHSGNRPYKCTRCDKAFATRAGHKKHTLKIHNIGEPQITRCDLCNIDYPGRASYLQHVAEKHKSHSLLFKKHCDTCGKTYRSKYRFEAHVAAHSDVDGRSCEICNKVCRNQISLNNHKVAKHEFRKSIDDLNERDHHEMGNVLCENASRSLRSSTNVSNPITKTVCDDDILANVKDEVTDPITTNHEKSSV